MDLSEINEPIIKDDEVIGQIHTASVNLLDSLIKKGDFKLFLPYRTPIVDGHDLAAVVTKIGGSVEKFKVSKRTRQWLMWKPAVQKEKLL